MNLRYLTVSLIAALWMNSALADMPAHWSYEGKTGVSHWAELSEEFKNCKAGHSQSPINIETNHVKKGKTQHIKFAYKAGVAEAINTGHTIQVNTPNGGSALIDGTEYKLVQFHFHAPSEEIIDGKAYPMEVHLVHKNAEGKLAVVGVLFKQGKDNQVLKNVFTDLPAKEGEKRSVGNIDAAQILPANKSYFSFMGSLTTPPCSEDVKWHEMRNPIDISAAQMAEFKKLYKMNARPVQSLNGRTVELIQ